MERIPRVSIQSAISCASSDKTPTLKPNGHQIAYEGDHDVSALVPYSLFSDAVLPAPPGP